MANWASSTIDLLWRNGLTAIPLVLLTAAACRWIPSRPATRHTMWLVVLAWLVMPPLLPEPPTPEIVSAWMAPLLPSKSTTAIETEKPIAVVDDSKDGSPRDEAIVTLQRVQESPPANLGSSFAPNEIGSLPSEPDTQPMPTIPKSSPLPSPRMASRTASRSPDVLAQTTGAVGPLSASKLEAAEPPIVGKEIASSRAKKVAVRSFETSLANREGRASLPIPAPKAEDKLEPKTKQGDAASASVDIGKVEPTAPPWSWTPDWRKWVQGLSAVRDTVIALPPIPAAVWLAGTAFLLLMASLRIVRFRRRLARAVPAPESVARVVKAACRMMKLRGVPETLMIDGRLSPMIWCGPRPRLILPAPLWSQLDEPGRRAVVFHELAHLRRCDHWVSWADTMIGSLYWWHPLVWWARRRLHAEAEVCCDAWVTSLLPRTRRAYAEALLATRQYVAGENEPVPALGIGVTTGRAGRFARRLTMVMTESVKPRLSGSGLALVLMMAATGWLASPAQSCPNDDHAAKAEKASDKPCATPCAKATAAAVSAPGSTVGAGAASAPTAEPDGATTYEQHMANRKHPGPGDAPQGGIVMQPGRVLPAIAVGRAAPFALAAGRDDDRDDRLRRLEEELARMEARLERLADSLEHRGDGEQPPDPAPRAPRAPRTPHPAQPPMPAVPLMPPIAPAPPMPPMPPGVGSGSLPGEGAEGGEVYAQSYSLPQGKLEALTQLMSRSDVPILVRRQENALEVNATQRQHRIFAAFVRMIDPSAERRGDGGPPGDGDRVSMLKIDRKRMAKEIEKAAKERAKAIERREKRRAKTGARMEEMKNEASQKAEAQEALEREAEHLGELAENLDDQAEEIRERAERIEERAGRESERDRRAALERDALTLRHQAEAIDLQKHQLEERARAVEDRAREAEDQAREVENSVEQLEEQLRQAEQEEAGEDNDDEGSHASIEPPGGTWWSAMQPALEAAMESLNGRPGANDDAEKPQAPQPDEE